MEFPHASHKALHFQVCDFFRAGYDALLGFKSHNSPTLIVTNPPWGIRINQEDLPARLRSLSKSKSIDSFSFVIAESHLAMRSAPATVFAYVVPEAFFNVQAHAWLRDLLLTATNSIEIRELGRAFFDVFTNTYTIALYPANRQPNEIALRRLNGDTLTIDVVKVLASKGREIPLAVDASSQDILDKIEKSGNWCLQGNAQWALGIVTGNNSKHLMSQPTGPVGEPIYRGKEVFPYYLGSHSAFIKFDRETLQQVAGDEFYRAPEKLIYRFISKRIIVAYDDQQRLCLNSANILIPAAKNVSMKVVAAILNSDVVQFYFQKKFGAFKVLRSHLEKIPLPYVTQEQSKSIVMLVDELRNLEDEGRKTEFARQLNKIVCELYYLTVDECRFVNQNIV